MLEPLALSDIGAIIGVAGALAPRLQARAMGASMWAPSSAPATDKIKINFLDTPGYSTFLNDTRASLDAADAVLILVDAAAEQWTGAAGTVPAPILVPVRPAVPP